MAGFIDWAAIRQDYLLTDASQRDLAKKYGVSKSLIAKKAKEEDWKGKRGQFLDKVGNEVIEATRQIAVDRAIAICESADKLLVKVNQLLDLEDALAPRDLKSISSTLLDLKMIHGIKSEAEKADEAEASDETLKIQILGMSNDEIDEVLK